MVRITALSDKSDQDVRYDLFERLNTGGISLTPQEVRACIFRGDFIDFVAELASYRDFNDLLKLQRGNKNDGTKEEIVLKFFAYKNNRNNFVGNVKDFLNNYTKEHRGEVDLDEDETLFKKVVSKLCSHVGGQFLRQNVSTTPLNQLEAALVGGGELIENGLRDFQPQAGWIEDAELVYYSTGGTNTSKMLEGRIQRAKQLLSGEDVKDSFDG